MHVLRAALYRMVPWKNGLGTTREILRHPAEAEDFDYRLSIAEITQSCAFSAFPGYERIIMLLDGGGFVLHFADDGTHALDNPHAPFRFDGGAPVSCTVRHGPSRDLNLMVRRAAASVVCDVVQVAGRVVLAPAPGAARLVVALTEGIAVRSDGQSAALGLWDTACMGGSGLPADAVICESAGSARLFHAVIAPSAGQDDNRTR